MKGLLYKECRQGRWILLSVALIPAITLWVLPVLGFSDSTIKRAYEGMQDNALLRLLMLLVGAFVVGFLTTLNFEKDESQRWFSAVSSTPKGYQGAVYARFVYIFMVCGLFFVSQMFWEHAMATAAYVLHGIEIPSITQTYMIVFFVQLILRALEMPFLYRFGAKQGATIKIYGIALVFLGIVVALLFIPLPDSMDELFETVMDTFIGILHGDPEVTAQLTDGLLLAVGILPYFAVAAYAVSFVICRRIYRKGAELYEK